MRVPVEEEKRMQRSTGKKVCEDGVMCLQADPHHRSATTTRGKERSRRQFRPQSPQKTPTPPTPGFQTSGLQNCE